MNEMIEKTIYSKKYPKKDYSSVINNLQDETDGEQDLKIDFDELYRKITEDGVYVSIPGRQKLKKSFVNQAIEISDMYELDIEITQKNGVILVSLSFDCVGFFKNIKGLFILADEIGFVSRANEKDITILLNFYTHKHYTKSGELIEPVP